ncbi:MAG: tRNA (adenosine(37)-N6)-dimethylallyltransferase MiaA [Bacteroidota bacterium]
MQQLIVIQGATASGKTALGVVLAQHLNTVVISADSRQFYKEIAIGTAKPTVEEMQGIPHYFVDSHSIHQPVTAAQFAQEAMELLQTTLKDYPQVVVVGGSGLFIDALCIGLDPIPTNPEMQLQLRSELEQNGLAPLLEELQQTDPAYFQEVDRDNATRILRALEVIRSTGKPFSAWRQNKPAPRPFTTRRFVIEHPREQLYQRINQRVDNMLADGLLDEVKAVYSFKELASLQTVGYNELFDYLDGISDWQTSIDKIKQHTRNYAKRQLTWFKRHPEAVWIPYSDTKKMLGEILQLIDN